jgi:DNA polymerase-3 subunit beta
MKFNVSSHEFLQQLNKAAGAIGSNPVLPVLEDFLFEISGNKLQITATNLETTIITEMTISVEEEGRIAVPAKILLDTLKALPDQPITFDVNEETRAIEITSAYGKYKLAGDSADDYPEVQQIDSEKGIELDARVLSNALNKTLFATSSDELRVAMTGVFVQVDFNKVTFVATDAHKLVKYTYGGISTENTGTFIVPKKALSLLKGVLSSEGTVMMTHGKTNVSFELEGSSLLCRLIDANYPDYQAVIPVDNPNLLVVSRTDFLSSLKRIAIYANKTTNQVVLNVDDGSLTISAQDIDFSNEATEQLTCTYTGDSMVIGFNGKFLIDILNVLDTEQIKFELSNPNRAGIILPDEQGDKEDLLMLVMPVMMGT